MGRRWSDIPWVVEQRTDDAPPALLARCRDRDVATYLARVTSAAMEGDITLRDASMVNRDRVLARFNSGKPVKQATMPARVVEA